MPRETVPHSYEPAGVDDGYSDSLRPSAYPRARRNVQYARYRTLSKSGWGLELLSSLGSLVIMAGIITIFWWIHDEPLSKWQFPVSINAVIAILSTFCTACMMHNVSAAIGQLKWLYFKTASRKLQNLETFDEASRGPYGSAIFIFNIRWNLATIGAFITIFRLAFAPFVQQGIYLEPRNLVTADDNTTFGFAHAYDRNMPIKVLGATPDPGMQAAIFKGLYNINTTPLFNCTGACTWNKSQISLGFKSSCKNVTMATLETQHCDSSVKQPSNPTPNKCTMMTPAGLNITTEHKYTGWQTSYMMNATSMSNEELPSLLKFAVFRSISDEYYFNALDVEIVDCSMSLTAYEYSNAKANGSTFTFGRVKEVNIGRKPWNTEDHGSSRRLFTTGNSTQNGVPRLTVVEDDLMALTYFFQSRAVASEFTDGWTPSDAPGVSAVLMDPSVNLTKVFHNVATQMTDYVRSGPNMQLARGQKIDKEIFVSIRWIWLAGPIAVELMSVFFIILTIVTNAGKRRVPLWKSSALAMLSCRYSDEKGTLYSKVKDLKQLEEKSKHVEARWRK